MTSCPAGSSAAAVLDWKRTLPFERKGPEARALNAAAFLDSLLVARAGEGDVARNNIKLAASLSVGAA